MKAVKVVEQPKIDWANPPAELIEETDRGSKQLSEEKSCSVCQECCDVSMYLFDSICMCFCEKLEVRNDFDMF